MDLKKPFYYCSECKLAIADLDDLLFIDELSLKGFCSEECIEDFYVPLIKHYEIIENSLRIKHNLVNEFGIAQVIEPSVMEDVLEHPTEVFRQKNELRESYYHFIKNYPDFTVIIISSVYRKEPSFVFLSTMTSSKELINEFRYGEKINWSLDDESEPEFENFELDFQKKDSEEDSETEYEAGYEAGYEDEEGEIMDINDEDMVFIQLLESKKSRLLADILMKRKESDIPFEDYNGYESCFQETLDFPDEVFEKKDNEGDVIFTYIKSFTNIYYIVSCLRRKMPESEETVVYPILAIPTTDIEMYQEFRAGKRLTGPLKN
jgi:hypothetical protein